MTTASIKSITDNPIYRLLTPIMVFLLGIIGFLYVQGQDNLAEKIEENKVQTQENTRKYIKIETELTEFRIYNKESVEEINKKLDRLGDKLDRLIEK
ncbi:hypothetical protein [Roseivirga seohaensis]|uniref:hypothetical protein n=1 Tax=Roseivirga seohaensis TaxID=1914963 RepID=UPI003BAC32DA